MQRPYPNDPRLTGIAIAFKNNEMIADAVMPRVPVGKSTFKWLEWDIAQAMTLPETMVGRKGRPTEVDFTAEDRTGGTSDYGLDDVIPNDDVAEQPEGIDVVGQSTEMLTNLIVLSREVRVAAAAQNTSNYNHSAGLSGTGMWDNAASDPAAAILDAINTPFTRPNIAVTSLAVFNKLRRHPKIVAALNSSGSSEGMVSKQQLADYLELQDILVGSGWVNIAKPGQTPNYQRVWGKTFALQRRAPITTTRGEPSWGFTAEFGTRVGKQILEPKTGLRGAVRVRVGESVGEVVQSKEAGYLFTNVIA
jgi:hypothetical protein